MIKVDEFEKIRKAYHVEGLSIREISRQYKHSRRFVRKALEHPIPEKYQLGQPKQAKVLGQYRQRVLDLLEESGKQPRKQRYTAHKIYTMVYGEGYRGCEGNIHNFVCRTRKKGEAGKAFLPLEFEAGKDAQVDWGEAVVILAGVETKVQFFVMRLNYSRVRFVKAYPFQKQEAFLDAHESAFQFLGGVPQRIAYDNLKTAVFRILEGHNRQEQDAFKAFRSYYLFDSHYCNPAEGHEKGGVESDVGYVQRNFFAPFPRVDSYEELNQFLLECCKQDVDRHIRGQEAPVSKLWEVDQVHLLPLPRQDYPACETRPVKANAYSQVVFETNRYSVPHTYAGKDRNDGEELWQKLVRKNNFLLTFNGHVLNSGLGFLASRNDRGDVVHQMLVNYQMRELGGEAYLRILEFLPDGKTVRVRSYSPLYDKYLEDAGNQFSFRLDQ